MGLALLRRDGFTSVETLGAVGGEKWLAAHSSRPLPCLTPSPQIDLPAVTWEQI